MKIPFAKLHGAKNDFLLTMSIDVPAFNGAGAQGALPQLAIAICDRHTGVGADGWMIVDRTVGEGFDAAIRLFNSDGSEPELSGNGTRCAAALIAHERPDATEFRIRTGAGIKHVRLLSRKDLQFQFEMNMGKLRIVDFNATVQGRDAVIIDAGNPQCAMPVDEFDFDWRSVGAAVERDLRFPDRTNVSFFRPAGRHVIEVRFWERGAGETNSSGTGSAGAALAAIARGLAESPLTVITPAGPLDLRFDGEAYLTGPAEFVAEGIFHYLANEQP